jgi:hypothetical protein
MRRFKTLKGIAREIGASNFVYYAKNYGNSRVNLEGSVSDAENVLFEYRCEDSLINHFNEFGYTYYGDFWKRK